MTPITDMRKLCLALLLLVPVAVSARDVIRLGFTDYPPFIDSNSSDEPRGSIVKYIETQLRRDFDITWIKLPSNRSKWAFETGKIDAYPFLARSREREAYAYFPAKPYMTVQSLLCSTPQARKPADEVTALDRDLDRSTVVHPEGSNNVLGFLDRSAIKKIRLPYDNYNDRAVELLDSKRADYAIFVTSFGIRNVIDEGRIQCRMVGDGIGVYFAFAKNSPLIPKVEAILKSLEILRY